MMQKREREREGKDCGVVTRRGKAEKKELRIRTPWHTYLNFAFWILPCITNMSNL